MMALLITYYLFARCLDMPLAANYTGFNNYLVRLPQQFIRRPPNRIKPKPGDNTPTPFARCLFFEIVSLFK